MYLKQGDSNLLQGQPPLKWASYQSPTNLDMDFLTPHAHQQEHVVPYSHHVPQPRFSPSDKHPNQRLPTDSPTSLRNTPKASKPKASEHLKSDRVTIEDPTWKVLPAALKKFKVDNGNWQDYSMFICHGPTGMPSLSN
jgi:hypothetical protein